MCQAHISCTDVRQWGITDRHNNHPGPTPGPCITNVIATCRKNFSQWESSFLWKLRCHWLKFLRRVAKTLVIQGPGSRFSLAEDVLSEDLAKPRRHEFGVWVFPIALNFGRLLRSIAIEAYVKFKSDTSILTPNFVLSRHLQDLTIRRLMWYWIGPKV